MDGFAVLADDVVLDKTLTISKDAEIYLAGHTITNANGDAIVNNANLTIYDGMPSTVYSLRRSAVAEENVGAIVSGNGSAIVNNGSLTINGGIFEGTDAAAVVNTEEAEELVIESGSFVANNVDTFAIEYVAPETVTIKGGEFSGEMPDDDIVEDGLLLEKSEDGSIGVVPVALTIGDVGYSSVQKAINAAEDGDVITFAMDITQTDGVIVTDKNITIDLGNKTFTVSEGASTNYRVLKINGSSVVTVKNGTLIAEGELESGAYGTIRTEDSAQVTLDNLKLYSYRGFGLNVKACSGTTIAINNCTIDAQYSGGVEASGGTVELNNTTINQTGVYSSAAWCSVAIGVNGGGKATVNSGTYNATAIATDANASKGTWVAYIMSSGGDLIINGGVFNGTVAETASAANACGLICADTAAVVEINGGTFNSNGAILDMRNNTGGYPNPKATLKGGVYSADPRVSGLYASELISVADGYGIEEANGKFYVGLPNAKVGNTEYIAIDNAIANWTNNTTLTLLSDVTLSDVVKIKSTEHHILDLSTYTLYAAEGKHAFEIIACGTGDAERTAITIKADSTNPGGINAAKKSIVYYDYSKGQTTGNDRPIIKIEGGVFTASTSSIGTNAGIYTKGSAARKCATLNISGGTFNCSINGTGKSKLLITGGTFNYSVASQGDSTALRLISGGRFKTLGFMTADSNNTKFWIGTAMANSNVGVYIDDEGYIVVGGAVITEAGDRFVAHSTKYSSASSYLQYSSAKNYGLYYTSVYEAFADNTDKTDVVTVYVDEIDLTSTTYKGTINIVDTLIVTFTEGVEPTCKVATALADKMVTYTDSVVDGVVTRTYTIIPIEL